MLFWTQLMTGRLPQRIGQCPPKAWRVSRLSVLSRSLDSESVCLGSQDSELASLPKKLSLCSRARAVSLSFCSRS